MSNEKKDFQIKRFFSQQKEKIRYSLIGFLIILLALIVIFRLDLLLEPNFTPPSQTISIDWRGISAFLVTIIFVLFFRLPDDIYDELENKKKEGTKFAIILLLFIVGIVGIWFVIRAIGVYLIRFTTEGQMGIYQPGNILTLLGYIVAANLPFTLLKAYKVGTPSVKAPKETDYTLNLKIIAGILDVVLQAVLVSLITFIPIIGEQSRLAAIGGYPGFVTILLALLLTFVIFILIRKKIYSELI